MSGLTEALIGVFTTPLGAIGALIIIAVIGLFAWWVFKEQP